MLVIHVQYDSALKFTQKWQFCHHRLILVSFFTTVKHKIRQWKWMRLSACCSKCPKTTLKAVCTIFQVFWQSCKNRLKFKAFFTIKSSCFFNILEPFVDIHCAKGNVSDSAKFVICVPLNKVSHTGLEEIKLLL